MSGKFAMRSKWVNPKSVLKNKLLQVTLNQILMARAILKLQFEHASYHLLYDLERNPKKRNQEDCPTAEMAIIDMESTNLNSLC